MNIKLPDSPEEIEEICTHLESLKTGADLQKLDRDAVLSAKITEAHRDYVSNPISALRILWDKVGEGFMQTYSQTEGAAWLLLSCMRICFLLVGIALALLFGVVLPVTIIGEIAIWLHSH